MHSLCSHSQGNFAFRLKTHLNVVVVVEVGIISTVSILPPPKSINHIKSSPARPVKLKAEHSQHIKIDFPMQSMHFCNIQLHWSNLYNLHVQRHISAHQHTFPLVHSQYSHQVGICYDDKNSLPSPIVHFFLTLFKRPLTSPLVLNMYVANFFEQLLKKCVNACHDKIRKK